MAKTGFLMTWLISFNCFVVVQPSAFLPIHTGSPIEVFEKDLINCFANMYISVISQVETALHAGLLLFKILYARLAL